MQSEDLEEQFSSEQLLPDTCLCVNYCEWVCVCVCVLLVLFSRFLCNIVSNKTHTIVSIIYAAFWAHKFGCWDKMAKTMNKMKVQFLFRIKVYLKYVHFMHSERHSLNHLLRWSSIFLSKFVFSCSRNDDGNEKLKLYAIESKKNKSVQL